jgi:hypothetical protein
MANLLFTAKLLKINFYAELLKNKQFNYTNLIGRNIYSIFKMTKLATYDRQST